LCGHFPHNSKSSLSKPTIQNMPKKTKQIIPAKKAPDTDKDYQNLLDELKSIIAQGQYQAYKAVDNIKVRIYWQLGERIVR